MPSSLSPEHKRAISDSMKRRWEQKHRHDKLAWGVVEEARSMCRVGPSVLADLVEELPQIQGLINAVQELEDAMAGN